MSESVDKLQWVKTANPIEDAKDAVTKNDYRLMAVYGFTLMIPGVDYRKWIEYRSTYGVNPIEGTSDGLESDEHASLVRLATKYSKQYNEYIISEANIQP